MGGCVEEKKGRVLVRTSALLIIACVIHGLVCGALTENACGLSPGTPASAQAPATFSYADLLRQLIDLERLAVLPTPGETCRQASSYDRSSRFDETTRTYLRWDANGDDSGILRREGGRDVLAEISGPGVIWRIWSAKAEAGIVSLFLDGEEEPAVAFPFRDYFSGAAPPFLGPGLCHVTAQGKNAYVPIPFQKSCTITAETGWGAYYHFTYSTYPQGTVLPTFRRELSAEENALLQCVNRFLHGELGTNPIASRPGEETEDRVVRVQPGRSVTVLDLAGPRAITDIRLTLAVPSPPHDILLLNQLTLSITWDNDTTPAVWAPLGAFFGTAPGYHPYRSLPMGMADGLLYSYWYMPFAERAVVSIANDGCEEVLLQVQIRHAPVSRPMESLGRFHAKWHPTAFPPDEPGREIDWTLLKTTGRGRFVGTMLHVWNPLGGWWGEGDEKFFVDGETFPSTFGTGSEDYFGYAWCDPTTYQSAFHSQTVANDNRDHTANNRWHIADNVPFLGSFEASIEKYFSDARPTTYAAVVYWYLAAGGVDPYPSYPLEDRIGAFPIYVLPRSEEGVHNAEDLKVLARAGGILGVQLTSGLGAGTYWEGWLGGAHLWWTGGKPGDRIKLAVNIEQAGLQEIVLQLTRAPDYGIVQISLDDAPIGAPVDLYSSGDVMPTGPLSLGERVLSAGLHVLAFEILGANPAAIPRYSVGIDYVQVRSAVASACDAAARGSLVGERAQPGAVGERPSITFQAEELKIAREPPGRAAAQSMQTFGTGWLGDAHLWWTGAKPGDRLALGFLVADAGCYDVALQMTRARDYGVVQLLIDNVKAGLPFDLYSEVGVLPTGPLGLGQFTLTAGDHTLTVEIVGKNPAAVPSYMAGVDYLRLTPCPPPKETGK